MSNVIAVQLEWKYSPRTYLEESILINFDGGSLEISDGIAFASIDSEVFHATPWIQNDLTKRIESRLHAVQMMAHKDFALSKPVRTDIREDGKKNYFLQVDSGRFVVSCGTVDLAVFDKDGKLVADSKRERLDEQNALADLIDRHRASDAVLDEMLKSYRQSVKDSDDELVHLYEIRDILSCRFGSKTCAIRALGVRKDEWDQLGQLANVKPLKQGRHRGRFVGSLRDAELAELKIARKSAVRLIKKYLDFLEVSRNK